MNPKRANRTIVYFITICIIIGSLVICNVMYTMITGVHFRSGQSVSAYGRNKETERILTANRGVIYDRNKEVIAQDVETYNIRAILDRSRTGIGNTIAYVEDPKLTAEKIAPILGMSVDEMMVYFETGLANNAYQTEFGVKGRGISTASKEAIEALELPGIEYTKTADRYYPMSKFASNLIGFARYSDEVGTIVGELGLEKFLNDQLTGEDGLERYSPTSNGTALPGTDYVEKKAVNGNDVQLTLDKNVQISLESLLSNTIKNFKSENAWAIAMEVETGKILGWSSYPTFDLNKKDITEYKNILSQYQYEPGSVMKGITFSAAIDSGNYPNNGTYRSGSFHLGVDGNGKAFRSSTDTGTTIADAEGIDRGVISYDEGFKVSSNVAICELLTSYLPANVFDEYLDRFGFFKPVGMVGVDETTGVKNFNYPIDQLSTGFGQASSVTALQMVQAYTAILNDGKMMKPYYIDKITNSDGEIVEQYTPEVVGTPITKETSEQVRTLMEKVVNEKDGTGYYRYRLDDVTVIAKTGTGEVAVNGKYDGSMYINSVIAAAPADDPKVLLYWAFESPDYKNFDGNDFKNALRSALVATGITGDPDNNVSIDTGWKEYNIPSMVNHSLSYAKEKLVGMAVNTVVIGNGENVIRQSPEVDEKAVTKQNVFLLTNGSTITMPNMVGWSRKDVTTFWELTNIPISTDGYGVVKEQSIKEGEVITKDSQIKVTLK